MATSNIAPLRTHESGRYLVDKSDEPFFWLGDTQWLLYRSFPLSDMRKLLADRKRKGFSVVQVMLIGYEQSPMPNINGDLPWLNNDPTRPNERYWEHVDAAMQVACEMDLIQVLGVYHKWQNRFYTAQQAKDSAHLIARRYRDIPQIVWSMYPEARAEFVPVVRAMADGLQRGDGGSHLITVHPDPSPQSSSFIHQEPWLAFNTLQAWNEIQYVYPMTAADYGMTPTKPAIMGEGGYEEAPHTRHITPLDIRRQAYWTYLAGGHVTYGHDANWQRPAEWREWIDSPGSRYMEVYRKIITSLTRWWEIAPDQSIFASGTGSGAEINAAGRALAGDWALVYFSSRAAAKIRMDRLKAAECMEVSWIDPATGSKTAAGRFAYRDVVEFTPPDDWDDALLLIEAAH